MRSKRPHLLQSCECPKAVSDENKNDSDDGHTYDFTGVETGPPPGGGVGGGTIETLAANPIAELRARVVGVHDLEAL